MFSNGLIPFQRRALGLTAICSFLIMLLLAGCESGGQFDYKSASAGKADEVLWVMNDGFWADTIGATVNRHFLRAYGVLPQAEPAYFLRKKNFNQFNNDIIKKYRTIVVCATRDTDIEYAFVRGLIEDAGEPYQNVVMLEDVWASPQYLILVTANNKEELLKVIQSSKEEIEAEIKRSEDARTKILLYEVDPNMEAVKLLSRKYNFTMDIPFDYFVGINNADFTWLRKETVNLSSNILVYKRQLEQNEVPQGTDWADYAINIREYLGKSYISTSVEGSYMEIEDRFAPVIQDTTSIGGIPGIKTEGLWRIEGDFMGGPFVNYSWFDESSSTFYMIDMYVHAPKEGKKTFMRHLDYIFHTFRRTDSTGQ